MCSLKATVLHNLCVLQSHRISDRCDLHRSGRWRSEGPGHCKYASRTPCSRRAHAFACFSAGQAEQPCSAVNLREERGVTFDVGNAFYRCESIQGRDLAVLAAAVYKRRTGQLRVLDVMAGSGVRAVRYLQQADADMVWSNDMDTRNRPAMQHNACVALYEPKQEESDLPGMRRPIAVFTETPAHPGSEQSPSPSCKEARVSHFEAKRLLSACYVNEEYFDLIDCDAFGSESMCIGPAIDAVKFGGLLYLTSTDGFSSGGKRPWRAVASYGAYTRAHNFSGEQGLRMLIGAAVREAAVRGMVVRPVFSLHSPHGPVFRAMVQVTRSRLWPHEHYGFVGHCYVDGETRVVPFHRIGEAWCQTRIPGKSKPTGLNTAGPYWTGPLHSEEYLREMAALASEFGWTGYGFDMHSGEMRIDRHNRPWPLEDLLELLIDESCASLPPWFVPLRDICKYGRLRGLPPRDALIDALRAEGFQACRTHVETRALKTNATMAAIVRVCVEKMKLPVTMKADSASSRDVHVVWEHALQ